MHMLDHISNIYFDPNKDGPNKPPYLKNWTVWLSASRRATWPLQRNSDTRSRPHVQER